jgi:hypothetical protein
MNHSFFFFALPAYMLVLTAAVHAATADIFVSEPNEYKLTFYTGGDIWAGTDAGIYLELIGELANSPVFQIKPRRSQLEANSVDTFSVRVADRLLGPLKSIVVGKQHTYAFFNDWQLVRVEIYDPFGKKYTFNCDCWLTRFNLKQQMTVSSVESVNEQASGGDDTSNSPFAARHSRLFPLTIFLLFLLFLLVLFSYLGNNLCKRWRDNISFLTARYTGLLNLTK